MQEKKKQQLVKSCIFYHPCELFRVTLSFSLSFFICQLVYVCSVFFVTTDFKLCFQTQKTGANCGKHLQRNSFESDGSSWFANGMHVFEMMACRLRGTLKGGRRTVWTYYLRWRHRCKEAPPPLQLGNSSEDGRGHISNSVKTQEWANCPGRVSVIGPTLALTLTIEWSKCYLLGRLCMTYAREFNWRGAA